MAEALVSPPGDTLEIATDAGLRVCRVNSVSRTHGFLVEVTTGMGVPTVARRTIVLANGTRIEGAEVSTGNPHFVIHVENAQFEVAGRDWRVIGAEICTHPDFPNQTNIEFVHIISPEEVEIRIFERGVGPTLSSGTGTSASAAAVLTLHGCASPLKVVAPGGPQTVAWRGEGKELQLTGPAALHCARRGVAGMTKLVKPAAVAPGAGVSVISPASFAFPERVERGIDALRKLGFALHTGENTLARGPHYFAGTTGAAPCRSARGLRRRAHKRDRGASRRLRFKLSAWRPRSGAHRRHPKPFFAYSDLTGVQLHLLDKLGLPAFHGPMVAADFYLEDGVHLPSFRAALAGEPYTVGEAEGLRMLKPGTARGTLYGGCLSILASLLGTPFEPQHGR